MTSYKKSLNVLDLLAVITELAELRGSIIDKVYTMGNSLLLRFRRGPEKYFIIANSHRFGLTSYVLEHGAEGVTILRQFIENARLKDLNVLNFDRIIRLAFDSGSLIIELLEPWNAIYVDNNNIIRWVLRTYRGRDRVISNGLEYKPPPQGFTRPTDDYDNVVNALRNYDTVGRAIARGLGLGGEVANEVCARALINCASPVNSIDLGVIVSAVKSMINSVIKGDLEPTVYYNNGMPITVTPIKYLSIKHDGTRQFSRFNEAVDEYFHEIEVNEETQRRLNGITGEITKLERSIDELAMSIEGFKKGSEELRVKAELVLNWKYVIEELLGILRNYWVSYRDEFQDVIKGMEYQGIRVKGFDPRGKAVLLDINGVVVSIPLNSSVGELISELFNRAKELERKARSAEEVMNQLRERIEELKVEGEKLMESIREKSIRVVYGAKEWFERFRWFVTSGGRLVMAGRDATQNEVLVRHYLRPWDVFVHADIPGAAAVVIRLIGPNDMVSNDDVYEAAQYAVSYSRAWAMGLSVLDVFYVRGEQVTKKAPSGEYLGKGSFMVYGARGWVRNVELGLGIGVRVDHMDDVSLLRLITAPPRVIGSLVNYYAVLRPGPRDRVEASREIYNVFRARVPGFVKVINLSNVVDAVPGPSVIDGFYEGNPVPWDKIRELK